jgi:hypothetical protein
LEINLAKSELVPMGPMEDVEGLACIIGCRVPSLPKKYLDLLWVALSKAKSIWDDIIEKIERRSAGWKRL